MTSLVPKIITGNIVPGKVVMPVMAWPFNLALPSRVQRAYVTNIQNGPPIKMQEVVSQPIPPRPTGDEKNQAGLMKILQNVMQKGGQQSEAIAKALPGDRSWRG